MRIREQMRGVGQVYRFTLVQHVKNKANMISLIVMLILAMTMVPLASLMMGGALGNDTAPLPDDGMSRIPFSSGGEHITYVGMMDETGFELGKLLDPYMQSIRVVDLDVWQESYASNRYAVAVHVYFSPEQGAYRIETFTAADSLVDRADVDDLVSLLADGVAEARATSMTDTERSWLESLSASYAVGGRAASLSETSGVGSDTGFAVEYAYSIVLLMLCLMSSSYIIRAVVEEKSSKLIDLLLVSVQPLALLCGKILAMMTVVFGTFLTIALGTGLSTAVTGMFLDTSVIGTGLGEMGISLTSLNLGVGTVIVVIISLLFSYLTYSIMSGIAGASCSSMNDVEGAMMGITLTAMVGYVVACAASAVPDRTVALLTSLIPIVSSFCAPAHYICGRIGMGVMLLSWAIQIGMIIVLALLGANVYRDLILYRGKRLRLRDMLRIAGMRGGVRRDA